MNKQKEMLDWFDNYGGGYRKEALEFGALRSVCWTKDDEEKYQAIRSLIENMDEKPKPS